MAIVRYRGSNCVTKSTVDIFILLQLLPTRGGAPLSVVSRWVVLFYSRSLVLFVLQIQEAAGAANGYFEALTAYVRNSNSN